MIIAKIEAARRQDNFVEVGALGSAFDLAMSSGSGAMARAWCEICQSGWHNTSSCPKGND